jgi:hypothetical protein
VAKNSKISEKTFAQYFYWKFFKTFCFEYVEVGVYKNYKKPAKTLFITT